MKRWIALLLAAMLLLGTVSGCAGKEAPVTEPQEPEQKEETEPQEQPKEEEKPQPSAEEPEEPEAPFVRKPMDYNDPDWFDGSLLIDIDCDWPMIYLDDLASKDRLISRAQYYFDRFNGTRVTDVMLCCFEQSSYIPSETMDWVHEKVALAVEAGKTFEGYESIVAKYPVLYRALTEYEIDWYQLALDCAKEAGLRPWIYMRMNDLHYVSDFASPFHDSFYAEAAEKGYLVGGEYGNPVGSRQSIGNAYDFSHKEVRDWMLAYIDEVLTKYDAFGLQLDFMRNIYCFDYLNNPDCAEIMTGFIRDVRALLSKAEELHGHPMKLMIRLGRSVEDNLTYGFDVAAWTEEKLIDAVVPSPEAFIDSGIPVDEWKEVVGDDIAVFPGFEMWMMGDVKPTLEQLKGYWASFYSRGADGLYFNNYYQLGSMGPDIWNFSRTNVSRGTRTYVESYQDICPIGNEPFHPFPMPINESESGTDYGIDIGPVKASEYIYLIVGYSLSFTTDFVTEVTLNGMEPVSVKKIKPDQSDVRGYIANGTTGQYRQKAGLVYVYAFRNLAADGEMTIHFTQNPGDKCNVEYCELLVQNYEQLFW